MLSAFYSFTWMLDRAMFYGSMFFCNFQLDYTYQIRIVIYGACLAGWTPTKNANNFSKQLVKYWKTWIKKMPYLSSWWDHLHLKLYFLSNSSKALRKSIIHGKQAWIYYFCTAYSSTLESIGLMSRVKLNTLEWSVADWKTLECSCKTSH